ncbi:MAG: hypothetical protein KJ601_06470 [Nanoarchaeota archaeon]|nr:hypothetical protein [Nanoarchaeota archaeon]MBU1703902.1 hypothetical protein [Nanoarchaeota archaeon]
MMQMKSNYLKSLVEGKSYSAHFGNLLFIEYYILGKKHGMGSAYRWHELKDKYPNEIKAIWTELDPKGYERFIKAERDFEKECIDTAKEVANIRKQERAQLKKEWTDAGGVW